MLEELLGSKCRLEVLKNLFMPGSQAIHLRGLERKTKLSCPALLHELRLLTNMQLITAEQDGNMVKYSANHRHFLFSTISELIHKAEGEEGLLRRVFASSPADVVFIFGSVAKGTCTPESDLDLCVIGNMDLYAVSSALCKVADDIPREINPYVLPCSEWTRRLKSGDHFLKELMASPKIYIKGGEDGLAAMAG